MPLTNVWTQDHTGEWVRTTASAMDRVYENGVSASSHAFRCYNCFQYVTFVKGNEDRISHFKHSRGEEDKNCEDRSLGTGGYTYGNDVTDVPDPMRIQFDGNRASLEIGFFPVSADIINQAIQENVMIRIRGGMGTPDVYRVDWTRFEPHSMTWLHLPFSWAMDYAVEIEPMISNAKIWDIHRTPLQRNGTVFDAVTGKRIPEKSDITVGREYYIVCDRRHSFYSEYGIQIGPMIRINDQWRLYRMSIPSYNGDASDFCFEMFRLRLTTLPSEIQLLWPSAIEGDNLIDTNQKHLYMYVKGEADFEAYPSYGIRTRDVLDVGKNEKIYELNIVSTLQMVSTTRYSQRLSFQYIRPLATGFMVVEPTLQILDDDGRELEDELQTVPVRAMIRILSDVDATADVDDKDGFLYRVEITSGQETRIQDLKRGMRIVIRQGLEIKRKISIGVQRTLEKGIHDDNLAPWRGRLVSMPSRFAWILTKMDPSGELYKRTRQALQDGMIPMDGLKCLNKLSGGKRYGE